MNEWETIGKTKRTPVKQAVSAATPGSPAIPTGSLFEALGRLPESDGPKRRNEVPSAATSAPAPVKKQVASTPAPKPVPEPDLGPKLTKQQLAAAASASKRVAQQVEFEGVHALLKITPDTLKSFIATLRKQSSPHPIKDLCDQIDFLATELNIGIHPFSKRNPNWEGPAHYLSSESLRLLQVYVSEFSETKLADYLVGLVKALVEGQKRATIASSLTSSTIGFQILIQVLSETRPSLFLSGKTSSGNTPATECLSAAQKLIPSHPAVGHTFLWVMNLQHEESLNAKKSMPLNTLGIKYWMQYILPAFEGEAAASVQAFSLDYIEKTLITLEKLRRSKTVATQLINVDDFVRLIKCNALLLQNNKKNDIAARISAITEKLTKFIYDGKLINFLGTPADIFTSLLEASKDLPQTHELFRILTRFLLVEANSGSLVSPVLSAWTLVYENQIDSSAAFFGYLLSEVPAINIRNNAQFAASLKEMDKLTEAKAKELLKPSTSKKPSASEKSASYKPEVLHDASMKIRALLKHQRTHKFRGVSLYTLIFYPLFVYFLYYSLTTVACASVKTQYLCLNQNPTFIELKDQTFDLYQSLSSRVLPVVAKVQKKVEASPIKPKLDELVSRTETILKEAVNSEQGQAAIQLHRKYVEPNVKYMCKVAGDRWHKAAIVFVHDFIPRAVVHYETAERWSRKVAYPAARNWTRKASVKIKKTFGSTYSDLARLSTEGYKTYLPFFKEKLGVYAEILEVYYSASLNTVKSVKKSEAYKKISTAVAETYENIRKQLFDK
ncbi:hypothetical protein HDV05_008012 [Chytridiales sp. JEL 0842]|nr:hypothetical protein HDV05_008012 [Chytridiales sp. JEL 0842]